MIEVRAFRSDAMIEAIYEREGWADDYHPPYDLTADVTIGEWDYVQLTYAWVRVAPDGDFIGTFDREADEWKFDGHEHPFSDVSIYANAIEETDVLAVLERRLVAALDTMTNERGEIQADPALAASEAMLQIFGQSILPIEDEGEEASQMTETTIADGVTADRFGRASDYPSGRTTGGAGRVARAFVTLDETEHPTTIHEVARIILSATDRHLQPDEILPLDEHGQIVAEREV